MNLARLAKLHLAVFTASTVWASDSAEAPPSPFVPAADATPEAGTPQNDYELVGVTAAGDRTLVSIQRLSDQRSIWIPVGKTLGEISVLAFDARKDEVTARINGAVRVLKLRQSAPVTPATAGIAAPTTTAANPTTPPPLSPTGKPLSPQEEKEMEARMLVSDLLEIGQQQRKAYEEAQKQAGAKPAAEKPEVPAKKPAPPDPARHADPAAAAPAAPATPAAPKS